MNSGKSVKLFKEICKTWAPPPKLTGSEWADTYRKLSPEASSSPGQWKTEDYQKDVLDAATDPEVEKVILMWSSQVGKTEIELNTVGYYIHQDPSPIMVVLPTKDPLAKDWSRDRLAPMIRDTEVLAKKVSDPKARDGDNSTLHKKFPGGLIVITGANVAADLASRPMRILLCDEVDRFPSSAGTEGDPIALAEKRQQTFWNYKRIYVSTPTIEGDDEKEKGDEKIIGSRIAVEYNKGTRELWKKQCPHCGEYVFINHEGMKFKEDKDSLGNCTISDIKFECPICLSQYDERTWKAQKGKWIAESPHIRGTRSFHLNAFYSPWYSWDKIIKEWVEAKKDPKQLQVVTNTLFGLPYKDKRNLDDEDKLLSRKEHYGAELPEGALLLTCGVDTQDTRLEYEIVGWGKDKESWGIEFGVIPGKPDNPATWNMLDDRLDKIYRFADGKGLKIACTCVDSGGHYTTDVYRYCKKNAHRRIFAIKGQGGPGIPLIHKVTQNNSEKCLLIMLGVDEGKTSIISSLKEKEPGANYMHFPHDVIDYETGEIINSRGYGTQYFKGLLSERPVVKKSGGVLKYVWEKVNTHARNEALDTRNYAQAAKEILKPDFEVLENRLKNTSPDGKTTSITAKNKPKKRTGCVKKSEDF